VAEKVADHADCCALAFERCGIGMSQSVGMDALVDASLRSQAREQVADVGGVDAPAVQGAEHWRAPVDAALPSRSIMAAATTSSPKMSPQAEKGLLEVTIIEARS
jgi:hypothetical protein